MPWFLEQKKFAQFLSMVQSFGANVKGMGFHVALYLNGNNMEARIMNMPAQYAAYQPGLQQMANQIIVLAMHWLGSQSGSIHLQGNNALIEKYFSWLNVNAIQLLTILLNDGYDSCERLVSEQISKIEAEHLLSSAVQYRDGYFWKPDGTCFISGLWVTPSKNEFVAYMECNSHIATTLSNNMALMSAK